MVATLPEVPADLLGAIQEKAPRELADSDLVRRIWESIKDLRDVHGVSEAAMANIVPENWRDRAFRLGEQGAAGQYCQSTTPKRQAPAKSGTDWGTGESGTL